MQAEALSGAIRLTWKDPADEDLWGIEITSEQSIVTRSLAPIGTNTILVAKGQEFARISNLAGGADYSFTVKTIDKAGNKSVGVKTETVQPLAGVPMTLTLTQSPAKETWTKDKVSISLSSSTSVKQAKWMSGVKTVKEVFTSGTGITGNSFEVSENGAYSVAVQDNDGRREVEIIEIKNIDKTAPTAPLNFTASYQYPTRKIVLNWSPSADSASGLKEYALTYTVNGANGKTETIPAGTNSFELTGIEPKTPPEEYAFTLKAVDKVGNESTAASTKVSPSEEAEITAISLDRTHLDTIMTNRAIQVTLSGNNFNKLTSLTIQVMEGSTEQASVPAVIDQVHNKATATVTAPTPSYPTNKGTTYTVKLIVDGAPLAGITASFVVSNPARVTNIALSPSAQIKLGSTTKVTATITGTNFDIRGVTKIKLLNSSGTEVLGSTVTVDKSVGTATEFTAEIPLPTALGFYTVAVYFDDVKDGRTKTLHLYDAPVITSVTIPNAGTSYGGNKLPVTITGKNFQAPGISSESFNGNPAISDVKIVSDTLVTAMVICPYTAGDTTLTVSCGSASKTGTISVKDYSAYTAGKIVLSDGTLVAKEEYTAIEEAKPPVAIIAYQNAYGLPKMIGLHTSSAGLSWAPSGTTGYKTKFESIICRPSETESGAANTATFSGDVDGSDNWAEICKVDPVGTADAATNYPVFHWVNTYNETYKAVLGSTTHQWYMPSIAELCAIYKNKAAINASLAHIAGLSNGDKYAQSNLLDNVFRSSSQLSDDNLSAWLVGFSSGNVYYKYKYGKYRVCCVAGFQRGGAADALTI